MTRPELTGQLKKKKNKYILIKKKLFLVTLLDTKKSAVIREL